MKDANALDFGKHKGKALINVPPDYLLWLQEQDWFTDGKKYAPLRAYIKNSMFAILMEEKRRMQEARHRHWKLGNRR